MNVRKTTGGGPWGRVTGDFGRKCMYTTTTKRERRIRLIGVAIDMLDLIQYQLQLHGLLFGI